jgi:hypothetical protein
VLTRPPLRAALLAAACLSCALAPSPGDAAQVWTALAVEKIRPGTAARPDATAVRISAARNEFEPFQIVITGSANGVRATASDLTGPGGATIRGVRLFREALMQLTKPSAVDGAIGPWPDALVPDVDELVGERRNAFPFDVPPGESRAIWGEVLVPADAPAGEYSGTVTVAWADGAATVPVTLTVWPFRLPSTASLRSAFKLSYGGLPSAHGVSGTAFAALRARYGALALDHRISLSHHDDGLWSDLGHFDQYYGPLMDGAAPTDLAGAEQTSVAYVGRTEVTPLRAWASHYEARGWYDRLFHYTCDEPPLTCTWDSIVPAAATVHSADPEFRTLVTTSIQEADAHGVTAAIDIIVPAVNFMDDRPGSARAGNQRARYDAFLAGSPRRQVWLYQSCMSHDCGGTVNMGSPTAGDLYYTGWPSYMIDASAVRNRAMQWLAFRYGVSGELYYETTQAYGGDPWTSQYVFSGNGDGTLFYPGTPARVGGTTHVPIASIRLKMIREGMEDYEYLKLLADAGDAALAREIADALFPNAYTTDQRPADLMAARARIAARLVALAEPGAPPPDATPSPEPTPEPSPEPEPTEPTQPSPSPLEPCTGGDAACLDAASEAAGGCGSGRAAEGALGAVLGLAAAALLFRRRPPA